MYRLHWCREHTMLQEEVAYANTRFEYLLWQVERANDAGCPQNVAL
jgi:hypothetical protein